MSVPVRISREGRIVDPDRAARVSQPRHDDVRWIAQDGGGPWKITFGKVNNAPSTYPPAPGSPFTANVYIVDRGGSGGSAGGPIPGAGGRTYRYTVSDFDTGEVTDDPDVDVES